MLLIHGDDDRNVRFSQTTDLVRRLEKAGVPYEELVIPDDTHHFHAPREPREGQRRGCGFLRSCVRNESWQRMRSSIIFLVRLAAPIFVFEPQDGLLTCPYCGHKQAIPESAERG